MARKYRTSEGESLDWICWRAYGRISRGLVERVLEVNSGLADLGPSLPAGVAIILPDVEEPAVNRRVRLWG
ncbi:MULTISPECIES: tail protein X [unclassified Halomonas]|uniref:tail protein X n=1 Tax=unclassified Halomonas TaxID=2609666 RepID=UPI002886BC84|nr:MULTISPECIES: tail protein X [unclassified Halomonas]MDT0499724.1 tail protein X [Halomonas sp. PAR7]MDT0510459.1 tail protein X [Halomonas sp. LES1]MDT0589832.1 tail protein X [Halomonas sp. PAR8]